jgi:hypothetical protein
MALCLTKQDALKTYGGSGYADPGFLVLGTSWRRVVSFTPLSVYSRGKSSRYTLNRRLGGLQSLYERYGKVNILYSSLTRTPISVFQPVASHYTEYAAVAHSPTPYSRYVLNIKEKKLWHLVLAPLYVTND